MVGSETRSWGVVPIGVVAAVLGAPPTPAADLPAGQMLPVVADEVVAARSARTARFRLPHRGGLFAEVASGRPLHVRDAAGRWQPTRAAFASRGQSWVADGRSQRVEIQPEGYGEARSLFRTGRYLSAVALFSSCAALVLGS